MLYILLCTDCYMTFWSMTICNFIPYQLDIALTFDLITELYLVPEFDLFIKLQEVSINHL